VGALVRALAVKDAWEALIPPHERHEVTVGAGIAALVLTLRTGEQAWSRVADTVAGYDLEVMCQRPMAAAHVHDHRGGRALDALGATGLDRMDGLVLSQAIDRYALDLARLHTAAPSLKVYGADARDAGPAGHLLTGGDRRDHRPDLNHRLLGLTVTAEGVPVWGHVTDGHQRDSPAPRCHLPQVRPHRPDRGAPLLGADRTGLAGETMPLAAAHRCRWVPLVPQTVGRRPAVVEAPERSERPVRWEPPGRRQGEREPDRGASGVTRLNLRVAPNDGF